MHQNETIVATLVRYFRAFKRDELNNEPARLLCEYFYDDLELDDDTPLETAVSAWLETVDLSCIGGSAWLGGVTVTDDVDREIVDYGGGDEYTWVSAIDLLKLAHEADVTGNASPAPAWFEPSWRGITLRLAEQLIEEMNCAEVMEVLASQKVKSRIDDGGAPEFKLGLCWYDDPKVALLELLDDLSPIRRAQVLRED